MFWRHKIAEDNDDEALCRYLGQFKKCKLFDIPYHCDGLDTFCPYYEILEQKDSDDNDSHSPV